MSNQPVFDNYEISPCHRLTDDGRIFIETCEEENAQFWTLYGHITGEGVQAIGDFDSREHAEQVYRCITGLKYTGSYEADARLKLMHSADQLAAACRMVVERWESGDLAEAARCCQLALERASGNTAAKLPEADIHELLTSRRQIAAIWGIEDVQGNRPDLSDQEAWQVLQEMKDYHDCNYGITWESLEYHADRIFPQPDAK